ncbi:hypothetical protein EV641_106111 [Rhodococcus sp. SMB37]|uniref:hypothetical protein n=1 Tax=Rhodococcus sp. SMB37 TaxID=2512213 RepID=UPI0010524D2D|nr:hypothetical protein [Rhodococcus sp. SMB37]TCN53467.1 hypothetical protein EV641_106111 [Rhodococcus sp. SMB37]
MPTSTTLTKAERRAEQRRVTARERRITKRAKELRVMYHGCDDLEVPSDREIVERYCALRDTGRLPANVDELEGTLSVVRRRHSSRSTEAHFPAMIAGVLALIVCLMFFDFGDDPGAVTASGLAGRILVTALATAVVVTLVWAAARQSERDLSVVFRGHADALLSQVEAVEAVSALK